MAGWRVAILAFLVALLLGCGAARAEDDGYLRGSLTWQGVERNYLLRVPPDAPAEPMPLVVVLHGAGEDAGGFAEQTHFAAAADPRKMLVVFPNGVQSAPSRGSWNAHFCCGAAVTNNVDDIGFIGALIDHIAAERPVDRSRVYATGMSNGGMFAYQLAAMHPDWFAAIAPVSAAIGGTSRSGESYMIRAPARPMPVMMIHGRKDSYVLFDGGSSPVLKFPNHWKTSVADALTFWAAVDGCAPEPKVSEPVPGKLSRTDFVDCRAGSAVMLWEIEQGEHEWPTVEFPSPEGPITAAAAILDFFAEHRRE